MQPLFFKFPPLSTIITSLLNYISRTEFKFQRMDRFLSCEGLHRTTLVSIFRAGFNVSSSISRISKDTEVVLPRTESVDAMHDWMSYSTDRPDRSMIT